MPNDEQTKTAPEVEPAETADDSTSPVIQPQTSTEQPAAADTTAVDSQAYPMAQPAITPAPVSSSAAAPTKPDRSKKLGLIAAIIAAIVVLGGASAGAYYGVVVPNKPENVLKKAVTNAAAQKKSKFDGKISYESTDQNAAIKAVDVTFNGSADIATNAFSSAFEVTASGIKLPFELRHVDKSLYLKIGDLSSLKGVVQSASPAYATTFDALSTKLANQWLEIDETLLKQANADCAVNASFAFTQEDVALLEKRYQQTPFTSIKNTGSDSVNGRSAIKYDIEINDNKAAEYFKGLQDLSFVKKLKDCNTQNTKTAPSVSSLADNDVTPLTIWVDKSSRQIVKLAGQSTKQDEVKSKFKVSFEVTMQYGQASITKPPSAKPLMEVLGNFSQLFNFNASMLPPGATGTATPPAASAGGVSQECLQAVQDYTNSGGTKPIPTCL